MFHIFCFFCCFFVTCLLCVNFVLSFQPPSLSLVCKNYLCLSSFLLISFFSFDNELLCCVIVHSDAQKKLSFFFAQRAGKKTSKKQKKLCRYYIFFSFLYKLNLFFGFMVILDQNQSTIISTFFLRSFF